MLVSGGQILAIDRVYPDGTTLKGDGVKKPLEVNTDVIATKQLVSNTSATLQSEIDDVSGKFNEYYKKTETSGKQELSDAFEGVIRHETEVSGDDVTIVTKKVVKPDGTVVYQVSATPQADIVIHGTDGISAAATQDGWTISYTGQQCNIYSGYPGTVDIFQSAGQWYISANVPDVSNFLTSATGHEDEALVLKNNQWVPADDIFATDEDISKLSATVASTYLSASEFKTYSANVDNRLTALESTAEHYTTNSANYYSTYQTVYNNSAVWNAHSALSATKLDASESAKFMKIADLQSAPENTISGYGESAFYYPPFPEIPEYTGDNGIEVTEEHVIKLSAEFLSASDKYLSANALDDLSGKWEDTANTVSTASAGWNEASAFGANSGKFVTSAGFEFEDDLAYFIKKTENSTTWSGVDLSDLGKMYQINSLTPDLISAGISADEQHNPFYVLSAAAPEQVATPDISGYGLSAWKDAEDNKYFVSANIVGNHGISAGYDAEANQWNVGISANEYAYLHGTYTVQAEVQANTIIKFDSGSQHEITIDEDGYIHLPDTGNKFTFCINETVENNISNAHAYNLNKIALVETDGTTETVIVSTQDYYPTEVGSSDTNIAITITHDANNKYAVKYLGSTIPNTANLNFVISIIEEISSLATTEGGGHTYAGVEPIWVNNQANTIGLAYDRDQFKIVPNRDTEHPELSALQINIQTTGGDVIDQAAFEKIASLIYGRMTETFPIAGVSVESTHGANRMDAYLFRPTIEYDCTSATSAFIYAGNADAGTTIQIAIYDAADPDNMNRIWLSQKTVVAGSPGGQRVIPAVIDSSNSGTIFPNGLYYAAALVENHQVNNAIGTSGTLGIPIAGTTDIGNPKPWLGLNTNASFNFDVTANSNSWGSMSNTSFKMYIGFKND